VVQNVSSKGLISASFTLLIQYTSSPFQRREDLARVDPDDCISDAILALASFCQDPVPDSFFRYFSSRTLPLEPRLSWTEMMGRKNQARVDPRDTISDVSLA
jgi:hypothetical protein